MIVYQNTKKDFLIDVADGQIEDIIYEKVKTILGRRTGKSEVRSWKESLKYMYFVLDTDSIPDQSGIAIEYRIPQTSKRIDFIISGQNEKRVDHAILVELKGWEESKLSEMDGILLTQVGRSFGEHSHPSYQVWSYAALLKSYNQTVYEENIELIPCAYLHNYVLDDVIRNPFYQDYLNKAPVFLKADKLKLQAFIQQFVKYGDASNILYRIDCGKIKPSKGLADSLASMLTGNEEFIMIDDQKIVFETAISLSKKSTSRSKQVMIVEGGPGTGKSVVAVNLLVELTKMGLVAQYVTKNAAPRAVYQSKLSGTLKKTEITNLFVSSGSYINVDKHSFDALIVDEAHRLNEKSGLFKNLGTNQIKEIIASSKFSIFFVDEDQKVTLQDIGDKEEIKKWAEFHGAKITSQSLMSQFRCNGSDGYIAWLDNVLQIHETANLAVGNEYDFKVFDSPSKMRDAIFKLNKKSNKARIVAGYCWDWISKKNPRLTDINFPEHNFHMQWNLTKDGSLWIMSKESVNEVGCIHTCQGLEVDYIGVIIGPDLIVRNGKIITQPSERSKMDSSIKGHKSLLVKEPIKTKKRLDKIIKNTYRALMSRGMKGCYIYCTDLETNQYFKENLELNQLS